MGTTPAVGLVVRAAVAARGGKYGIGMEPRRRQLAEDFEPVLTGPLACTLAPAELPSRLQQWQDLIAHVTSRTPVDGGLRLVLDNATPLGELAELIRAEQSCCSFFAFALTVDDRGAALEVRGPAEAVAMFG